MSQVEATINARASQPIPRRLVKTHEVAAMIGGTERDARLWLWREVAAGRVIVVGQSWEIYGADRATQETQT